MVTLEQIRQLDAKVAKAVELINQLRQENQSLKGKLGTYEQRINELEILINDFKQSQGEIENGIIHALQELDKLESSITPPKETEEPAVRQAQPEVRGTPEENEKAAEDDYEASEKAEEPRDEEDDDEGENRSSELDIF